MKKITDQKILKAVLMLRRLVVDSHQTKEEMIEEQKRWLEADPEYADRFDGWIDSMRADLMLTPEETEAKHEREFAEFLEREAEWDYREQQMYRDRERDEWDDFWSDRARDCGAVNF